MTLLKFGTAWYYLHFMNKETGPKCRCDKFTQLVRTRGGAPAQTAVLQGSRLCSSPPCSIVKATSPRTSLMKVAVQRVLQPTVVVPTRHPRAHTSPFATPPNPFRFRDVPQGVRRTPGRLWPWAQGFTGKHPLSYRLRWRRPPGWSPSAVSRARNRARCGPCGAAWTTLRYERLLWRWW